MGYILLPESMNYIYGGGVENIYIEEVIILWATDVASMTMNPNRPIETIDDAISVLEMAGEYLVPYRGRYTLSVFETVTGELVDNMYFDDYDTMEHVFTFLNTNNENNRWEFEFLDYMQSIAYFELLDDF